MNKTLADCKTDPERADYLATHDVFETQEFQDIGIAEPPQKKE